MDHRSRVVVGMAFALASAAFAWVGGPSRAGEEPDRAVVDTPAGRQAFEDVRAAYRDDAPSVPRSREAALKLASPQAEERAWAAEYLVALFRQTVSDQALRRTPRGRGLKLGPGPQDDGAAIRRVAIGEVARATVAPESTEALAPATWLWKERRDLLAQGAAMSLFVQIRHPDADAAISEAVRREDTAYPALEGALLEVALRKLPGLDDEVRRLCLHYRVAVREAAASAAKALGLERVPTYAPDAPFVPSLDRRVREMAARVHPAVPEGAAWVRFRMKPDPEHPEREAEVAGWRLPARDGHALMIDWFGEVVDAGGPRWEAVEDTLAEAARRLVAWREAFDALGPNDFDGRRKIESRMGIRRFGDFTGRTWEGILPEGLVAAWAYVRGDRATAAALLLPLLEDGLDEEGLFAQFRDDAARRMDERMLDAFVSGRYPRALRFARHLASPLFDGWRHRQRAQDLAEEVQRRGDDFGALALPTPGAWEQQVSTMPRGRAVAFLAARLRLLHARQWGIPGGISYADEQFAPGTAPLDEASTPPEPRINPYVELLRLDLRGDEVAPLIALLSSRDHVLAYDLERFGEHRPQSFHRVRWVAGSLLDAVAAEDLVDRAAVESGDEVRVAAEVRRLEAWFAARGDRRQTDRLFAVATGKPWEEANVALRSLAALAPDRGSAAAAQRAATDAEHRADLVRLVADLGGAGQLSEARAWVGDADPTIRFMGAWILLRHGDKAAREGIDAVLDRLRADDGWRLRDAVVDDLWASGDAAARAYVEAAARAEGPESNVSLFLLQRRVLAGDEHALARVLDALEGRGLPLLRVTPGDDPRDLNSPLEDADSVAAYVLAWRPGDHRWPLQKVEDAEKARIRKEVTAWLRAQGEAIRAGRPSEIERMDAPRLRGAWGWISSGWIRRL